MNIAHLFADITSMDEAECVPALDLTKRPLDRARLAMAIEAKKRVTLPDELVAQWRTLGDAALCVHQLLDEGPQKPVIKDDEDRLSWYYH